MTPELHTSLEELLADGIALAVLYFDCSQDYDPTLATLSAQIEADFANEHREEIAQVAAALAGE